MQEETERLVRAKAEIEERARKEREESLRMLNKQEEEKKQNDRFKQHIKEVERKIVEANECVKFMRKNIKFSYDLVSVMPDKFSLDPLVSENNIPTKQEIKIKVQNFETGTMFVWNLQKFYNKLDEIKDKMDSY